MPKEAKENQFSYIDAQPIQTVSDMLNQPRSDFWMRQYSRGSRSVEVRRVSDLRRFNQASSDQPEDVPSKPREPRIYTDEQIREFEKADRLDEETRKKLNWFPKTQEND